MWKNKINRQIVIWTTLIGGFMVIPPKKAST